LQLLDDAVLELELLDGSLELDIGVLNREMDLLIKHAARLLALLPRKLLKHAKHFLAAKLLSLTLGAFGVQTETRAQNLVQPTRFGLLVEI